MNVLERVVNSVGEPGKHDLWLRSISGGAELLAYLGDEWVKICGGCKKTIIDVGDGSSFEAKLDACSKLSKAVIDGSINDCLLMGTDEGVIYVTPPRGVMYYQATGTTIPCEVSNTDKIAYTPEQYEIINGLFNQIKARSSSILALGMDSKGGMVRNDETGKLYITGVIDANNGFTYYLVDENGHVYVADPNNDIETIIPLTLFRIKAIHLSENIAPLDSNTVVISESDAQKLVGSYFGTFEMGSFG